MNDLAPPDRSVIVTGASSGIGRATANAFAALGDHVTVADLDDVASAAAAATITANGGKAVSAIVNVTSALALAAARHRATYIASKGAILTLTRSIAIDFMDQGIRCNCVASGTVDSPWVGRIISDQPDPDLARRLMVERQPLGRLGRPEKIASSIVYLALPEASFVQSTCMVVDGGFSAR